MHRALQQARAEAAAQAQGTSQPAPVGTGSDALQAQGQGMSQSEQQATAGKDKKALGALLKKAAQQMQQEEQEHADAVVTDTVMQQSKATQQGNTARISDEQPADQADDPLDPQGVELSGLSQQTSESSSTELLLTGQQHTSTIFVMALSCLPFTI